MQTLAKGFQEVILTVSAYIISSIRVYIKVGFASGISHFPHPCLSSSLPKEQDYRMSGNIRNRSSSFRAHCASQQI